MARRDDTGQKRSRRRRSRRSVSISLFDLDGMEIGLCAACTRECCCLSTFRNFRFHKFIFRDTDSLSTYHSLSLKSEHWHWIAHLIGQTWTCIPGILTDDDVWLHRIKQRNNECNKFQIEPSLNHIHLWNWIYHTNKEREGTNESIHHLNLLVKHHQ